MCAEGGVSLSGLIAYLQCVNHTAMVLTVNDLIMLGVQSAKVFTECIKSLFLITTFHLITDIITNGGNVVNAIAYSVYIHHAASAEQLYRRVDKQLLQ